MVSEAFALGRGALLPGLGFAPGGPPLAPFPQSFLSLYPLVFCNLDIVRVRHLGWVVLGQGQMWVLA